MQFSRREFMSLGAKIGALMGFGPVATTAFADGLQELTMPIPPVLWLQGQACSGCSVSLLNTVSPSPVQLLTQFIHLNFHSTLSAATGDTAMSAIDQTIAKGNFVLVVEGSLPAKMPDACLFHHHPLGELVERAARSALKVAGNPAVVAVGACATDGGIPGAEGNSTGAMAVGDYLKSKRIDHTLVNIPGCPTHPDWVVGTIVHLLKFGVPALDTHHRPKVFFGRLVHDQCPRFSDYEREKFAQTFGDEGCLFKLGCLGPVTHADCTLRYWNDRTNTCIAAGAPCIGCAWEHFAHKKNFPFYPNGAKINKSDDHKVNAH